MSIHSAVVVGAGYVGLPTAALLAKAGVHTTAVDLRADLVEAINSATLVVEEGSINALLRDRDVRRNLSARVSPVGADAFFICVPTPIDKRKKIADLKCLTAACESIVPHLRRGSIVIVESTIPVLCTREIVKPILESSELLVDADIFLAHCPERVLPGNAISEITTNSRVIGGVTPASTVAAINVYRLFVDGELNPATDIEAEICKLSENAYRDVNIAFANELAAICEGIDVDPTKVIAMANQHPRVNILSPGIGVGGHCIPVDPWFISEIDRENSTLIQCARRVNDQRPHKIAAQIRNAVATVATPRIVAIGRAFKPNCRDERESPAIEVLEILRREGFDVISADPIIDDQNSQTLASLAQGADLLVVLVEHDAVVREIESCANRILSAMRTPKILRFYARGTSTNHSDVALMRIAA